MDPQFVEAMCAIAIEAAKAVVLESKTVVNAPTVDLTMDDQGDDGEPERAAVSTWADVFQPKTHAAKTPAGKDVLARCRCAPDCALLAASADKVNEYEGVPVVPPPKTADPGDKALFMAQQKLHQAMCCLVEAADKGEAVGGAASLAALGYIRSCFEDLQQERRGRIAKGKTPLLDPRPDMKPTSLFTAEELKKLKEANRGNQSRGGNKGRGRGQPKQWGKPRGRSRSPSPAPRWNSRSRSRSGSRGKSAQKGGKSQP